MKRTFIYQQ